MEFQADTSRAGTMRRLTGILAAAAFAAMFGATKASAAEQPAVITYCHGFGCAMKATVRFTSGDMAKLKGIVAAGRGSPKAERTALGKADQWYERRAGAVTGTSGDRVKGTVGDAFDPTQLDCIDESTNTTTLLKLIEGRGWLKHHKVGRVKSRGLLFDMRYPHNTATVIENETGEAWAIDSWIPANGEFPDIMPVAIWVTKGVRGEN
jgi:hypothetical protein